MGSGPFQGSKVGHVIIWADGTVTALRGQWKGAVELTVARRDADAASEVPALAYTDLMAAPSVGDRVLLNVAALDRGLGTGGYALVIAVLDAEGRVTAQPPQPSGHLVKARATCHCRPWWREPMSRARRTMNCWPTLTRSTGCRLSSPTCIRRRPCIARHRRPPRLPGCLRDERPGRIADGVLPLGGGAAGQRPACGNCDRRTGLRRRPGGSDLAPGLLAARLALGAELVVVSQGRETSAPAPAGDSRGQCRRGHQRCSRPWRPSSRHLANLRSRLP